MKVNIQERVERARQYFLEGYNCAQAVFLTYQDFTPLDHTTVATIAAPFGGGMGRLREVCGTVSGMTFLAGAIAPAVNPQNLSERQANYALVQQFADSFRKENGDIICRKLLGLDAATESKETPMPSQRTTEYYRKRPCVEYVSCAARIVAEYLLNGQ